jgi:hypothetical protein
VPASSPASWLDSLRSPLWQALCERDPIMPYIDTQKIMLEINNGLNEYALMHLRSAIQIEKILYAAVQKKFQNNISPDKIVGDSFSRLITLCFALDIVSQKTYQSLVKFKDIRNEIAHKENINLIEINPADLVMFLGKEAESTIQNSGNSIHHWYRNALELLIKQVTDETCA